MHGRAGVCTSIFLKACAHSFTGGGGVGGGGGVDTAARFSHPLPLSLGVDCGEEEGKKGTHCPPQALMNALGCNTCFNTHFLNTYISD